MRRAETPRRSRALNGALHVGERMMHNPERPLFTRPVSCNPDKLLEPGVTSVTERRVLRMLAPAPGNGSGHRDVHLGRREAGSLMRAVAKGLYLRATARAPIIRASLRLLHEWEFLEDDWFAHSLAVEHIREFRELQS